jgi:hypothetical protein
VTRTYLNRQATTAPSPHAKRLPPGGFVQTALWEVKDKVLGEVSANRKLTHYRPRTLLDFASRCA